MKFRRKFHADGHSARLLFEIAFPKVVSVSISRRVRAVVVFLNNAPDAPEEPTTSSLYTHTHTHTCGVFPSWLLFVIVGTACVSIPSDAIGTRHKKIFRLAGGQ